ncbi:MAG: AAA family ATPase, partial [Candidatus Omnitrophica bacterium]|nr:AAA family ATPase [Candidatus Omnitrophota bacterium]
MLGQTIANRYKLNEELVSDSLITLYKSFDQHDNKPVLLNLLSEKSLSRPLEVQLRFKRAVEQASKLSSSNILKILQVSESDNQTVLIQEYFEGEPLSKFLNQSWDTDKAVGLILQIASALSATHEQNLNHQSIKPQHILIDKADTVKLFNFGYSIIQDISRITEKEEIISTFSYLSPESSGILRKPVDSRSDIYSLGILFYQLLTGRLPYIADDISGLIHQHIASKPSPPSKANNKIAPVLDNIILRLIAKEPSERYQGLKGLIVDLKEYQAQRKQGKALIDFEIARQDRLTQLSFSTKLIGRDKELNELNNLLNKATQGQGSLAFVFGEPGIGKSRLIDELRGSIHSLNGLFCGGKCYQFEFRTPYKVFSEAIDAYIEKVKRLSQKEQEIHIKRIKDTLGELGGEVVKISPTLTDLIGTPPKLVELEPEKEKIRFLITVTNFLASLSSNEVPLLMFLDDLQWVDDGSLEILERLAEKLQNSPLNLIVSYRDTDVDQNHPLVQLIKKLKDKQIGLSELAVRSLSIAETSQMISQIIMEKEESVLSLAQELNERAQGNPFFTLELLHSLVDSKVIYLKDDHYTYDLIQLKSANLPTTIVEAVLKRMKDLSEIALQILSYASIMGKEIQFELLIDLTQRPIDQIVNSIEDGVQNQLLYRDITGEENIFFMHDRIREAFYQRVSEEERIPLHRHIAEVIEGQNKDNTGSVLYELAYHFNQAKVEDKALEYSIPAANKAKSSYANTLAISLYNTAKEILEKQNKKASKEYIEVLENLGEVYRLAGAYENSVLVFKSCESLIPAQDRLRKTQVLTKMSATLWEKGEVESTIDVLGQALRILKVRFFTTNAGVILGILKEFTRQMLHTWFPAFFIRKKYKASSEDIVVVRLLHKLALAYYFSDMNKCFYLWLKSYNMSEKLGPCIELAYNYLYGLPAWSTFPWFSRAFRDGRKGLEIAVNLGDKIREGSAYGFFALCAFLSNKTKEGVQYGRKGISILKGLGEYWELGMSYVFGGMNCWLSGDFVESEKNLDELIRMSKDIKALQPLEWGLANRGFLFCFKGDMDESILKDIKDSIKITEEIHDNGNLVRYWGILSYAYLRLRDYLRSIEASEKAVELFPTHNNKAGWAYEIFPIGAQVYLDAISEISLSPEQRKKYLKRAAWFCKESFSWAKNFQFFLAWSLQVNGTYYWLTGKKKAAVKTWEKGIKFLREKTEDKYRLAYILLEEAKFLLSDNPQDKKALGNLLEAKELFSSMGCKLDLKTCNELLQKIMPSTEGLEGREALTQRRHLESLLSTTRAIGSVFDLDELLNKIMDYAITVTGAERGFLLLYDDKTSQLSLKLSHGFNALEAFSFESSRVSLELIHEAEKQKDTLIASSDQAPTPKIQNELKSYNVKQALSAYLTSRDKPIGILYLDNQLSSGTFGKQELELMQSFAVQASVSLENAHLVSDLLDQARLRQ